MEQNAVASARRFHKRFDGRQRGVSIDRKDSGDNVVLHAGQTTAANGQHDNRHESRALPKMPSRTERGVLEAWNQQASVSGCGADRPDKAGELDG